MPAPIASEQSVDPLTELLGQVRQASGGRLLALHTDLARSPAVLAAYLGLRRAGSDYGTLAPMVRAAIMLAVGVADDGAYSQAIATQLAIGAGMTPEQTVAVRTGQVADARLAALLAVMREAAVNTGRVTEASWAAATAAGWSVAQLTEAFVFLTLTVFVDYFTHYARTELDVPPARRYPAKGATDERAHTTAAAGLVAAGTVAIPHRSTRDGGRADRIHRRR